MSRPLAALASSQAGGVDGPDDARRVLQMHAIAAVACVAMMVLLDRALVVDAERNAISPPGQA